jgi:hypothetical protein
MVLVPLREWICDVCGELIVSPEAGVVEWLGSAEEKRSGFRIVHAGARAGCRRGAACGYGDAPGKAELPLTPLVGEAGMSLLLSFVGVGSIHDAAGGPWVESAREFVEVTRRVTLPYYEEARTLWRRARAEGYFADMTEAETYLPRTLEALVQKYGV